MTASLKETDSKVQADAEVTAAARDAAMIVTAYRVYVLEVPKVHLLIGLDDVTAVADTLQQLVTEAQQSLDALQAAGVDTGAARRKLTDVLPRIESLRNNAQAQSNALIGLEAKGYPGNKSTLQSARNSLDTARSSVKSIRSDLKDEASLVH